MRKGVILIIVLGVMLVIITLALYALNVMTQQSRITERQIKQMRLFYAAQGGIARAREDLMAGRLPVNYTFGAGWEGYGAGITVNITNESAGGGLQYLNVTASY